MRKADANSHNLRVQWAEESLFRKRHFLCSAALCSAVGFAAQRRGREHECSCCGRWDLSG
jgi:hypothetical protein